MDAFSASAAQLMCLDKKTKEKVPSESRILQSAIDVRHSTPIYPSSLSSQFRISDGC
jgi:hypothetical protein